MRIFDTTAELTELGIEYVTRTTNSLRIRCPYHDDSTPSCDVLQDSQRFICRACHVSGDLVTLFARLSGQPRHVILAKLADSSDKPVESSVVLKQHQAIWSATSLLKELYARGVSDDTIKLFLLGEESGRVTIPIQNAQGMYVNIRKYLPGATSDLAKTTNLRGRGVPRLYPISQLRFNDILFCGGEVKALASAQRLNEHGIGAITLTTGEGDWLATCEEYFEGKRVWVCNDVDKTGERATEYRCARLVTKAEWVGAVTLPLSKAKHPKGDLNDFYAEEGDILALLQATPAWVGKTFATEVVEDLPPVACSVKQASSAEMVNKRFVTPIMVTAIGSDNYSIPKEVVPQCERNQDICGGCPVFMSQPEMKFVIPAEHSGVLAMMDTTNRGVDEEIQTALGIPRCPVVTIDKVSHYQVIETRVQSAINLSDQDGDKMAMLAVLVDQEVELNGEYEITGRTIPHPRSQRTVAVVSKTVAKSDALSEFKLENQEELHVFRPTEWTVDKIDVLYEKIYEELSCNVTKIYDRLALHQLVDLVYHSVLALNIGDKQTKGCLELLVVGDSAQGKTWVTQYLSEFYGLGERVDCKNATVAGLLGGLEQISGRWFVQWGVIPTHDRRLVILEELKGMRSEVLAKLTDMRSSGVAEVPKIIRQKAKARTRLIALSNPKNDGNLDQYGYGVNAIMHLVGAPEDVRRFDVCTVLSRTEVSSSIGNQIRELIPPSFTKEQARRLILWCWTRKSEQVVILPEALALARKLTQDLNDEYSDAIPILDRGGSLKKVIKLAAACAGRTFSASEDGESLLVRECHVQWVVNLLRSEYSKDSHGYLEISKQAASKETITDVGRLKNSLSTTVHAKVLLENLLGNDIFELADVGHWAGWDQDEALIFVGVLVRSNAITREGRGYRKSSAFTKMIRELLKSVPVRPAHVEKDNPYVTPEYSHVDIRN